MLCNRPQLRGRGLLVRCRHCRILFLTDPRNRCREDLGCPFGCREAHRKQESAKRCAEWRSTDEGKELKSELNRNRDPQDRGKNSSTVSEAQGAEDEQPVAQRQASDAQVAEDEQPVGERQVLETQGAENEQPVAESQVSEAQEAVDEEPVAERQTSQPQGAEDEQPVGERQVLETQGAENEQPVAESQVSEAQEAVDEEPVAERQASQPQGAEDEQPVSESQVSEAQGAEDEEPVAERQASEGEAGEEAQWFARYLRPVLTWEGTEIPADVVSYLEASLRLIEGRAVGIDEIEEMLQRRVRQRSMASLRRIDYILWRLQTGPP